MAEVSDLLAKVQQEGEPLLGQWAQECLGLFLLLLAAHLLVLKRGQHLVRSSRQDISKK